jgi:hypothetical protein
MESEGRDRGRPDKFASIEGGGFHAISSGQLGGRQ